MKGKSYFKQDIILGEDIFKRRYLYLARSQSCKEPSEEHYRQTEQGQMSCGRKETEMV